MKKLISKGFKCNLIKDPGAGKQVDCESPALRAHLLSVGAVVEQEISKAKKPVLKKAKD